MNSTRRTARLFVLAQFGLLAVIIFLPGNDAWPVPAWLKALGTTGEAAGLVFMVVAAAWLRRGLTATPLPNAHAQLRTGGPYRFVRHPIYSGLLLFVVANVTVSGSVAQALAATLLVLLINTKARWEEARLAERFPEYPEYASHTPRFVPRPDRARPS